VSVTGAVKAPGFVKYTKDLTVGSAIGAAGGRRPLASGRTVVRHGDEGPIVVWPRPRRPGLGQAIMPDPVIQEIRTDAREYAVGPMVGSMFDFLRVSSMSVGDEDLLRLGDVVHVLQRLF